MQLMVKPTLECQFRCDFCSAANYQHNKQQADNLSALLSEIKKMPSGTHGREACLPGQ